MASIFDISNPPPKTDEPAPAKRSKHKETLTSSELVAGRRKLSEMVERAFLALEEAMVHADHPTAVKAATAILDRAGFGPKSTVDVNTTTMDLSALTREELAERASRIAVMIRKSAPQEPVVTPSVH